MAAESLVECVLRDNDKQVASTEHNRREAIRVWQEETQQVTMTAVANRWPNGAESLDGCLQESEELMIKQEPLDEWTD